MTSLMRVTTILTNTGLYFLKFYQPISSCTEHIDNMTLSRFKESIYTGISKHGIWANNIKKTFSILMVVFITIRYDVFDGPNLRNSAIDKAFLFNIPKPV